MKDFEISKQAIDDIRDSLRKTVESMMLLSSDLKTVLDQSAKAAEKPAIDFTKFGPALIEQGILVDVMGLDADIYHDILSNRLLEDCKSNNAQLRISANNPPRLWLGGECPIPDGVAFEYIIGRLKDWDSAEVHPRAWHEDQIERVTAIRLLESDWVQL